MEKINGLSGQLEFRSNTLFNLEGASLSGSLGENFLTGRGKSLGRGPLAGMGV